MAERVCMLSRSGSNDKPLQIKIHTNCRCEKQLHRTNRTLQSMPASASAREAAVMAQGRSEPQSSITLRKKLSQRGAVKRQRRHGPAVHFNFALGKAMQAEARKQRGLRVAA